MRREIEVAYFRGEICNGGGRGERGGTKLTRGSINGRLGGRGRISPIQGRNQVSPFHSLKEKECCGHLEVIHGLEASKHDS